MRKEFVITLFFLGICFYAVSQELKMYEKVKVGIGDKANRNFPVLVSLLDSVKYDTINVSMLNKDTISYQLKKSTVFIKDSVFSRIVAEKNGIYDMSLDAEVVPIDKYLKIFFYPFEAKPNSSNEDIELANKFLNDHEFVIELPYRNNLSFPYSRIHAGVMTIPLKVYVNGENDDLINNVNSDVNLGFYIGRFFGSKKFVKIPSEKEYRVYDLGFSVNTFLALNKQEVAEGNRIEGSDFEGSFPTLSFGLNVAYHYKSFSTFFALGWDKSLSRSGEYWNFDSKPWVGIGLGFGLIK